MQQVFNELNARSIDDGCAVLTGLGRSPWFGAVLGFTAATQVKTRTKHVTVVLLLLL